MDRTEQEKLTNIVTKELSDRISLCRNLTIKDAYDYCKNVCIKNIVTKISDIDTITFDAIVKVSMMPIHKSNLHYETGE